MVNEAGILGNRSCYRTGSFHTDAAVSLDGDGEKLHNDAHKHNIDRCVKRILEQRDQHTMPSPSVE